MKAPNAVMRVALAVLLAGVAVEVGLELAPGRPTGRDGERVAAPGRGSPYCGAGPARAAAGGQPDWGGGQVSLADHSPAGLVDSAEAAAQAGPSQTQTFSGKAGAVLLQQRSGSDYSLTMAIAAPGGAGGTAQFAVPSSGHFRKQLFPGPEDADAPAADIPLYPQSTCRMQVGQGTGCFIGFYLTPDSIEAVRSFYVRALSKLGWQRITPTTSSGDGAQAGDSGPVPGPALARSSGSSPVETFEKQREDRTVVVQLREQDSATTRIGLVAMMSGTGTRSEGAHGYTPFPSATSPRSERK